MPSHRRERDHRRAERRAERERQLTGTSSPPFRPADRRPVAPEAARTPDERNVFACGHCGRRVLPPPSGGRHRNHCPFCLYSLHVDARTMGDRSSPCGGLMAPFARFTRPRGEEAIVHRCERCGQERHNRVAADDSHGPVRALPETAPRQTRRGEAADSLPSGGHRAPDAPADTNGTSS